MTSRPVHCGGSLRVPGGVMAITVKASCPACGTIVTDSTHVGVVIDTEARHSSFRVQCPGCHQVFTDNLDDDPELLRRLVASDALVSYL